MVVFEGEWILNFFSGVAVTPLIGDDAVISCKGYRNGDFSYSLPILKFIVQESKSHLILNLCLAFLN